MSREEQIKWLRRLLKLREDPKGDTEIDVALKCAIEALEKESCDDCISREEVCKILDRHWLSGTVARRIIDQIKDSIDQLPSVYQRYKTGRWIKTIDEDGSEYWLCSKCRCGSDNVTNFCPECGSDNSEG